MKTNFLKLGLAAVTILAFSFGNAQTTDPTDVSTTQAEADGEVIRLIDNKGTIKYLQSNNGITTITSTVAGNLTTTTWQLGGELTEATNIATGANEFQITLDTGGTFVIDGVIEETGTAATAATIGTSGYTFLVRDEATGEVRKLLASSLVESGNDVLTAAADTLTGTFNIAVAGMPAAPSVVWVYRNGAKLLASEYDATVAATVTVTVNPGTGTPNWISFTGDVYEVYWVK